MATVNPAAAEPKSTTAEDTLQRKSREAGVVSGGHLVAKALKNEGVDTIFTLCGGHIIDIYDGCVDEGIRIIDVRHEQVAAHAADGYARQTGKLGCVVTTAGPGCTNAVTGIATAFRSESPVLHIGGQGALTQHKMGSLQDLPHVDMMTPITKFAASVLEHRACGRHDFHGGARGVQRRARARSIWRFRGTCSIARSTSPRRSIPQPGKYRASTHSIGDPRDIEKLADILVNARAAGDSLRPAGVDRARPERGHRAAARPRHSRLFQRREPRAAAAGRSASLRPHPLAGIRQGRRAGDRRHARSIFAWATASASARISKLVQIDMDYRTVGKNRDIDLGLVGDPGAILGAVLQAATGRHQERQAAGAPAVAEGAGAGGEPWRPRSSCRCSSRTACRFIRTGWRGS